MKSGKAKQNGKEELRKTQTSKKCSKSTQNLKRARKSQNQHKTSKSKQKLKRARKSQNQHKTSKSTLPLKSTLPNTLNAGSPP
jgi:hypothetical protein